MRILVLGDVHSNWVALQAVPQDFDAYLFVGDLVDYGTEPVPCVDWMRRYMTVGVRGNHDHAVAQRVPPREGGGFRSLAAATRPLHWNVLTHTRMKFLARLPVTVRTQLGGMNFYMVHATPRDPMDEYLIADPDAWLSRLKGIDADIVCVGHTHIPFHIDLGRVQVLNPGSVGQPRDGDPRCSYAVIENGKVEIRRVEYDIDAAIDQMKKSGIDPEALQLSELVLRTGGKLPGTQPDPQNKELPLRL